MHISVVPEMFALIFKSAFTPKMDDELAFLLAEAHHNLGKLGVRLKNLNFNFIIIGVSAQHSDQIADCHFLFLRVHYLHRPRLRRYSSGLIQLSDSFMRSSLYQ